jgi:hypothetical protein
MTALAVRLLLVLALLAGAYWAGDHNRNNAWLAKQAKVERQAKVDYEAEVKRGDVAVGALVAEARTLQTNFQNLTEKFNGLSKRVPLVVAARTGSACAAGASPLGLDPGAQLQARPEALGGSERDSDSAVLTAGAVWMWNSALTGTDQPSGACGSADTSEVACAVATPIDLDDAWANHRANAQTCALNRLAHDRLIDFLTTKEKTNEKPL